MEFPSRCFLVQWFLGISAMPGSTDSTFLGDAHEEPQGAGVVSLGTLCVRHTSPASPQPRAHRFPYSLSEARGVAICTPLWEKETGNYIELMSQWAMADSSLTRFLLPVDVRTLASEAREGNARQGYSGHKELCGKGGERRYCLVILPKVSGKGSLSLTLVSLSGLCAGPASQSGGWIG